MDKSIKREPTASHQISIEAQSPPKQRSSYQSTRKYSSLNYQYPSDDTSQIPCPPHQRSYTPIFEPVDQDNCSFRNNPQPFSLAKKATGKIIDYR